MNTSCKHFFYMTHSRKYSIIKALEDKTMKHYIIVKLKDRSNTDMMAENAKEIFAETLAIPGVHSVKVKRSCSDKANRYDLMILMDIEPQALPVYDACDAHQRWKKLCDPLQESKAIFDCI